ncbi:MAG: hypothetical protein GY793_01030 [Proteobacteria bacterium]|nr:hypothetical protein [Pseudomonadota bacterium]
MEDLPYSDIQNSMQKGKVLNQGFKKLSEIAKLINDIKGMQAKKDALKKYLDIDLSKFDPKQFKDIKVSADDKGHLTIEGSVYLNTHFRDSESGKISAILTGLTDAQIIEKIANRDQQDNIKIVDSVFNSPKLKDQNKRKASEIASSIKTVDDLVREFGIDKTKLSLKGNATITAVATGDAQGNLKVEIKTNTPHATKDTETKSFTIKIKDDKVIKKEAAANNQKINEDLVKKAIDKLKIQNQGNRTSTEIAKAIKDAASLKKELGVDLPQNLKGSTIGTISATADKDGNISINVEVITPGATPEKHTITSIKVKGKSDSDIATKIANDNKPKDIAEINKKLASANLKNQGTDTGTQIADKFNKKKLADKLKDLKDKFGVDLKPKVGSTDITDVTLVANKKTGKIEIKVTTKTDGATPSTDSVTKTVDAKPDDKVKADIAQPKNVAAVQKLFSGAKLKNQGTRTIDEIVTA